jgi:hypothetical protein
MPLTYRRDDGRRLVTVTAVGEITLTEAIEMLDRRVMDGTWSYSLLYDGRQRTGTMDAQEVRILVELTRSLSNRHGPSGPMALVRDDAAGYSAGRAFGSLTEDLSPRVAVFRTMEEAEQWLDGPVTT